jgi:hypothetical protein
MASTMCVVPCCRDLANIGANTDTAEISPDGHWLAYQAGDLTLLDLTGHRAPEGILDCCDTGNMFWSPDSTQLAFGDNLGDLALFPLSEGTAEGKFVPLTGLQALGVRELVGWIDATHLAVTVYPLQSGATIQTVSLGSYDISARRLHIIATVSSQAFGIPHFALSPDGTTALLFNKQYRDYPYAPLVDEIAIANGAITPLPHLAQVMGPSDSGFTGVAWPAHSAVIAASTGFDVNGNLRTWVLDLSADAVVAEVTPAGYAAGWAPASSEFVLSSGWQAGISLGPFSLTAVAVGSDGHIATTRLTSDAMSFPFLGFARTA